MGSYNPKEKEKAGGVRLVYNQKGGERGRG